MIWSERNKINVAVEEILNHWLLSMFHQLARTFVVFRLLPIISSILLVHLQMTAKLRRLVKCFTANVTNVTTIFNHQVIMMIIIMIIMIILMSATLLMTFQFFRATEWCATFPTQENHLDTIGWSSYFWIQTMNPLLIGMWKSLLRTYLGGT